MSTTHKILIVDDEKAFLDLLREFLTGEGYEVISALNGMEGIETLKNNLPVSVIIADHKMPLMRGTDFLKMARDLSPDSMRIMLTAFHETELMQEAINKSEIFRFLTKPLDITELKNIIKVAVEIYGDKLKISRRHKVLLINQSYKFLHATKERLLKRGYDVLKATCHDEAIELATKLGPISVAANYERSDTNLNRYFENMKKLSPRTVNILFTGSSNFDLWEKYVNEFNVFRILTDFNDQTILEDSIVAAIKKYDQSIGRALLSRNIE